MPAPAREPPSPPAPAIVLFDGVCHLCNAGVRFIIRRDPHARFRFAPLQSPAAANALARLSPPVDRAGLPDSLVLIEHGTLLVRSAAALGIARRLRFPWPLIYGLILVPRPIRDWLYDKVARSRYRWFGRDEACMAPTPAMKDRLLEG